LSGRSPAPSRSSTNGPTTSGEYEKTTWPADTLASFTGQYEFDIPPGLKIEITLKDGSLFWADREMVAVAGGLFVIPSAGAEVDFVRDTPGRIVALDYGPPGGRKSQARRIQ
jgi:hypothetical protein